MCFIYLVTFNAASMHTYPITYSVYGVKYMCGTEDGLITIKIMKIHLITTKITLI